MSIIKLQNKNYIKLVMTLLITIFFIMIIIKNISNYIVFDIEDYVLEKVNKENTLILKKSFNLANKEDTSSYIEIIKNSKDEIIEVEFNIPKCTEVLSSILEYMNNDLHDYNYTGYRIDIPLGYKLNNPLFMNIIPKVPVKVELTDVAFGNVLTKVEAFGINNALVEVYLEIYLNTQILYPFAITNTDTSYKWLLASKIISGNIPSFYNGTFTSESPILSSSLN